LGSANLKKGRFANNGLGKGLVNLYHGITGYTLGNPLQAKAFAAVIEV